MLGNLNQADAQALMQLSQGRHLRVLEGPILRRPPNGMISKGKPRP